MEKIGDIPFSLDAEALMARCRITPGSEDAREFEDLLKQAREKGRPKAIYAERFIEDRQGDRVQIGSIWFESAALVRNLRGARRLFPFVATCGQEMDRINPTDGDMLKDYWWDTIKERLLGAAEKHLREHLHSAFRLDKTATMRPGAAEASVWPIEQQQDLFELLGDVEAQVGVRLTDSSLMMPNKSTSGLLFPTETDFRSCEVCRRENCPSREAAFNEELWNEIHTG